MSYAVSTSQLILQPFRCFTYDTARSPTLLCFFYVTGSSLTSPGEPPINERLESTGDKMRKNEFLPNKGQLTSRMRMLKDAGYLTEIRNCPLKSGMPGNPARKGRLNLKREREFRNMKFRSVFTYAYRVCTSCHSLEDDQTEACWRHFHVLPWKPLPTLLLFGNVMQMQHKAAAVLSDTVLLYDLHRIQFLTSSAAAASKTLQLHSMTTRSQLLWSLCHCTWAWNGKISSFALTEGMYIRN